MSQRDQERAAERIEAAEPIKIIVTAPECDVVEVTALIMRELPTFSHRPEWLGWGWSFAIPNGRRYFLAAIKGGVSARPVKARKP